MIVDLSNLAKFSTGSTGTEQNKRWDNGESIPDSKYTREFLMGYLMHYCRLCNKHKKSGTIPYLQAILELEPNHAEAHYFMARQYELEGDMEKALHYFERAAALRPDKPTYTLAGVRVACHLGERNKGLAMVCSVIAAYPTMEEAFYERGLIHETDENWGRAVRDYEECSNLNPENPIYACAAARMYRMEKKFTMARRCAVKALKLDPNYTEAHEELRLLPFLDQFVDFFKKDKAEAKAS